MDGAIEPPRMGLRRVLQPHTTTSDGFLLLLVGVDLGRHGRSTPCVDASLSGIEKRMRSDPFFNEKGLRPEQH